MSGAQLLQLFNKWIHATTFTLRTRCPNCNSSKLQGGPRLRRACWKTNRFPGQVREHADDIPYADHAIHCGRNDDVLRNKSELVIADPDLEAP